MIQILRHGNPMAYYMCDYWMPINALVSVLGTGAIRATTKEVLTMGIHTITHGRNVNLFQLMAVEAEGKKVIYIRTNPSGSPHTITHQGIKIKGKGKHGGKGWYSGGSSDSGKGHWATSSRSGSRDQWTINNEDKKGWSHGKWD